MPISAKIVERVKIPEKVKVEFDEGMHFKVTGPNGQINRRLYYHKMDVKREGDEIVFSMELPRKTDKAMVGTMASHLRNMFTGVSAGFEYQMKIVYAHFPIKVTLKDKRIVIENFMGEKSPRTAEVVGDTKIAIKGNDITLTGPNIEHVSQTAANIEKATRIKKRDPRVFQDGIYITQKK